MKKVYYGNPRYSDLKGQKFVKTGEYRAPKQGEFYLQEFGESKDFVVDAQFDFSSDWNIMKPFRWWQRFF